jgi:hypothetical protein
MKIPCLLLSVAITCFNCSKYQYVSVGSDLPKNMRSQFEYETDTLKVIYNYAGKNGPLKINVHNKHSQPLYLDWSKSSFISQGRSYPLWSDVSVIHITSKANKLAGSNTRTQSTGIAFRPDRITLIPPKSSIEQELSYTHTVFFTADDSIEWKEVLVATNRGSSKGRRAHFDRGNTPYNFRYVFATSMQADASAPFYIDTPFWIEDITNTTARPPEIHDKRANLFFVSEKTLFGRVGSIAAGTLVLLLILMTAIQISK